jgi:hypothetical protein
MTQLGSPRQIAAAQERAAREIRKAFMKAVKDSRASISISGLVSAIQQGPDAVSDLLMTRAELSGMTEAQRAAFVIGGATIADAVPKYARTAAGGRLIFQLDIMDPEAVAWLNTRSGQMIVEILEEQRQAVRTVVARGMEVGQNPVQTARDIAGRINPVTGRREGGIVGLTRNQSAYVYGGRYVDRNGPRDLLGALGELQSDDPKVMRRYLSRKRRDKRFDPTVKRAIETGSGLPASTINRIVGRYADRMLALRAETISRSESLQAFSSGRHTALEQLRGKAGLEDGDITRTWDATMDKETRPDHQVMNNQEKPPEEPFEAPDGSLLMYPGDRSLGAPGRQIIQCRCFERVEVDFIRAAARNRGNG